jgi:pimeloyl-ACP methyl ester carboxylesterase
MPFLSVDGTRIHYRVSGPADGEAVVLIMGLGMDMSGWDAMLPHLERYRVLRIDNRGAGLSDAPDRPYTIAGMARDVAEVMRAAGIGSAHVYGASLGSMVAQELALSYPDLVRTLVLGCPSPGVISVPGAPGILRLLVSGQRLTREEAFRRTAPYLFHAALENPAALQEVLQQRLAMPFRVVGFRRQLEAVMRWSSLSRLRRIKVPTLVVHGDHDRLIPIANGRMIARLIPNARLHVVKGAGHVYSVDAPGDAARAVLAFLDAQRRPAATADVRRP